MPNIILFQLLSIYNDGLPSSDQRPLMIKPYNYNKIEQTQFKEGNDTKHNTRRFSLIVAIFTISFVQNSYLCDR